MAIAVAVYFYVAEVGIAVAHLVNRLRAGAADELSPDDARQLAQGIALLLGALVAAATIPFILLRTWINERTATATEEGLITDRINKAVEGLGAEKQVTFHRTDKKGKLTYAKDNGKDDYSKPTIVTVTKPNLEVRIGAIYALERIAQDSERDHIQIMEILCAYIRENVPQLSLLPTENLEVRQKLRSDIQTAISVIGRRSENRKKLEAAKTYRLDLRNTDLSGGDFFRLDFSAATFP